MITDSEAPTPFRTSLGHFEISLLPTTTFVENFLVPHPFVCPEEAEVSRRQLDTFNPKRKFIGIKCNNYNDEGVEEKFEVK